VRDLEKGGEYGQVSLTAQVGGRIAKNLCSEMGKASRHTGQNRELPRLRRLLCSVHLSSGGL
jgi:hypothetical protein